MATEPRHLDFKLAERPLRLSVCRVPLAIREFGAMPVAILMAEFTASCGFKLHIIDLLFGDVGR